MTARKLWPGLIVLVGAALIAGGIYIGLTRQSQEANPESLSSGATRPIGFGGTVTDVDRDAKRITIALKWEQWYANETDRTIICDYSETTDKDSLELIERLSAGNEVRGYCWSHQYDEDPVPLSDICLENGSRGQSWVAANDRYPADSSFDESGLQ